MFGLDDFAAAVTGPAIGGIFSARQASIDKGWQEMMASTAVQRQATDMRAAGINPILAGRYGGAQVPGGAMASMQSPDVPGAAVSSAQKAVLEEQKEKTHHESDAASSEASIRASEDSIRLATKDSEIAATNAGNARAAAQAMLEARDAAYWMKHDDLRALDLQSSNVSSAAEAARLAGRSIGSGLQLLGKKFPGFSPSAKQLQNFAPGAGRFVKQPGRPGVVDRTTGEIVNPRYGPR